MSRKQEIAREMAALAGELQEIDAKEIETLANKARDFKLDWLSRIAEAMLHRKLGHKPTTKELGYALADDYSMLHRDLGYPFNFKKQIPADVFKTLKEMQMHFDLTDYIFAKTHYDECDNGFFRRRS